MEKCAAMDDSLAILVVLGPLVLVVVLVVAVLIVIYNYFKF